MISHTALRLAALMSGMMASSAWALNNVTESFDTDAAQWCDTSSLPLSWMSGGGPLGETDAYVRATNVTFIGVTDHNFRLAIRGQSNLNSSGKAFVGNWFSNGVYLFSVDVRHNLGVPAAIGVRLSSPANNPGASIVPHGLVPSDVWTTLVVPVASNMVGTDILSYGSGSFTSVFSSIGNIQVLLYAPPGFGGSSGPFNLDIDNPSIRLPGAYHPSAHSPTPTYDRWMYPFNASSPPGNRPSASTFAALGEVDFDERDGQVYVGFVVTNQIPSGLGESAYEILACRVTATMSDGETEYDPTQDTWTSYLNPTQNLYQADTDSGRPMELFGAGWRNGYTPWTFGEHGPYAPGFGVYKNVRNVYPVGFRDGMPVDVSNNIDPDGSGQHGFDPVVFAIGQAPISPGTIIPLPTTFTFNIDTSHPLIQSYLKQGLNSGILGFVLATLQSASQDGPSVFPVWDQKEGVAGTPATILVTYQLKHDVHIAQPGDTPTVYWPSAASNYLLEASSDLPGVSWRPLTHFVYRQPDTSHTLLPKEFQTWYLRLRHP